MRRDAACLSLWVVFGLLVLQVPRAEALTLVAAVRHALDHHPEVLEAEKEIQAKDARIRQSLARHLPTLDLNSGYGTEVTSTPHTRRSGGKDPTFKRFEAGIAVRLNLFSGFGVQEEVARATAELRAADARLDLTRNRVALQAGQAYLGLVQQQKILELAGEKLELHDRLLAKIKLWQEGGEGTLVDLQQAMSRHALARSERAAAQGAVDRARARFQGVVGLPPEALQEPPALEPGLPATLAAAIARARETHPELVATEAELTAAQASVESAKSGYWPSVNLEFNGDRSLNDNGSPGLVQNAETMVRVRYNLFNGGSDQARVSESVQRQGQVMDRRDKVLRALQEGVESAWEGVTMARERKGHLGDYERLSQKVTEGYREQFRLGQRSLLDLLNSENEVFSARTAHVRERYTLLLETLGLHASLGSLPEAASSWGVAPVASGPVAPKAKATSRRQQMAPTLPKPPEPAAEKKRGSNMIRAMDNPEPGH